MINIPEKASQTKGAALREGRDKQQKIWVKLVWPKIDLDSMIWHQQKITLIL